MDILDVLRRQAGRFNCPHCGKSLADCKLEALSRTERESLISITCAQCQDTQLVAVAVAADVESPPPPVRDEPVVSSRPPVTTDEVLDVRLLMEQHPGDLMSLLRSLAGPRSDG